MCSRSRRRSTTRCRPSNTIRCSRSASAIASDLGDFRNQQPQLGRSGYPREKGKAALTLSARPRLFTTTTELGKGLPLPLSHGGRLEAEPGHYPHAAWAVGGLRLVQERTRWRGSHILPVPKTQSCVAEIKGVQSIEHVQPELQVLPLGEPEYFRGSEV